MSGLSAAMINDDARSLYKFHQCQLSIVVCEEVRTQVGVNRPAKWMLVIGSSARKRRFHDLGCRILRVWMRGVVALRVYNACQKLPNNRNTE